ncbi:MAG: sugar phosphate isomerase/epimerase [Nitrososphaerota archaeon]|jgi:sugar phosphate isomerase/epimerase|nr:sugar phosphate isomerase/epimerase [Nitrososphaerota archaeon]MDG6947255.1 sugar phosphate isomerase/epimerase [Nitrososphaerota archaeon]MDG6955312.1 sugar phosphate isomerase/epimerase [Nitrososphaerota archaeon]
MKVGVFTAIFHDRSFEEALKFVSGIGCETVEIAAHPGDPHINLDRELVNRGADTKKAVSKYKLGISSLSGHANHLAVDPAKRKTINENFKKAVDLASALGVPVVNTFAGAQAPEWDEDRTFKEFGESMGDLVDHASSRNVKIGVEVHWGSAVYNIPRIERMFKTVPSKTLGLNYDPSHFVWQMIDYKTPVEKFGDRIYHVHAKDTEILRDRLSRDGVNAKGWWRFRVPGEGLIDWTELGHKLKEAAYANALSMEHEDPVYSPEEGVTRGVKHLKGTAAKA